jgi:hypothetical protein
MGNIRLITKKRIPCLIVLVLTACAQDQPVKKDTITICDSSGCAERPKNYASYNPEANLPDNYPDGRIAALENLAKADPRAAYDLALRLFRGDGVKQDSYRFGRNGFRPR